MFNIFDKKNRAGINILCGGLFAVLAFIACSIHAQAEIATSRPSLSPAQSKPADSAAREALRKGNAATDPDEQIRWYKKAIELDPKNAEAYCNLGVALAAKGDYDGAIRAYNKAIKLNLKYARAYNNLAVAYCSNRDYDNAWMVIEITQYMGLENAINPKLIEKLEKDSGRTISRPSQSQAQSKPANSAAYKAFCKGHAATDPDEKIRWFKKAIELDPKHANAYNNLGAALRVKGNFDGEIRAYKKAIELNPKLTEAHYNLGLALEAKGDFDGAIRACKKAIELNPKHAEAYCNLGVTLAAKGDNNGAIRAYNKAIELDLKFARAYNNLAVTYYSNRDYDNAWRTVETARRMGLGNAIHPKFLEALKKASGRDGSKKTGPSTVLGMGSRQ